MLLFVPVELIFLTPLTYSQLIDVTQYRLHRMGKNVIDKTNDVRVLPVVSRICSKTDIASCSQTQLKVNKCVTCGLRYSDIEMFDIQDKFIGDYLSVQSIIRPNMADIGISNWRSCKSCKGHVILDQSVVAAYEEESTRLHQQYLCETSSISPPYVSGSTSSLRLFAIFCGGLTAWCWPSPCSTHRHQRV